jgi:hypothetical protein
MAAIHQIKKGKKFYRSLAGNVRDNYAGSRKRILQILYVVDIDIENSRVLASVNGAPPQWFGQQSFGRWTEDNPALVNRIATCPACSLYNAGGKSRIAIQHTCGL